MYIPFSFSGGSSLIAPVTASGGTVVGTFISGGVQWKYHDFRPSTTAAISGSFVVTDGYTNKGKLLVVGGGGAGGGVDNLFDGQAGAGGGAGGVVYINEFTIETGTYSIYVGAGGSAGLYNPFGNDSFPSSGQNSSITFGRFSVVGLGGGFGATGDVDGSGANGGSGGGDSSFNGTQGLGLQPTSIWGGFGNDGGFVNYSELGANQNSAGGGGAGGVGGNPTLGGSVSNRKGGEGGASLTYNLIGSTIYVGGGGGGSGNNDGGGGQLSGGKGRQSTVSPTTNAENGVNATGGGGGGGLRLLQSNIYYGTTGGSGRLIITYPISGSI